MNAFGFRIEKRGPGLARTGVITTPHGDIQTPAFVTVGTKATVKALTPEMISGIGSQVVLANTYHLYLRPGEDIVREGGGLGKFMGWSGPTITDSGGFQVFSLGSAYGKGVTKVATSDNTVPLFEGTVPQKNRNMLSNDHPQKQELINEENGSGAHTRLAKVDDDGVDFSSPFDGSTHRFTPERSIEIQHAIGADIIVAFDECTSPQDPYDVQKRSLARTHTWAQRSFKRHKELGGAQALYGVIQGGKYQDLREEAARTISAMDFDGFGIGGSFTKEDIGTAVKWVNDILPENKPRHLLGIGEPEDLFLGVENGIDTFDCVAPTRLGRNGGLYTSDGRINLNNAAYVRDFAPIEEGCDCYTCTTFTRAYLSHLYRSDEMLAGTLGSIHNLRFIVRLVDQIRASITDGSYEKLKESFLSRYKKQRTT